ncbi:hypothetical protein RhiJN_19872 [Ceratobasidium sp. AG-Ba]|nr:hypothetical protein RhiJN_19872 [Ceratobasidium sp. AG-Ba]
MSLYCFGCGESFDTNLDLSQHHKLSSNCVNHLRSMASHLETHQVQPSTSAPSFDDIVNQPIYVSNHGSTNHNPVLDRDEGDVQVGVDETYMQEPIRHRIVCPTAGYTYGTGELKYHQIRSEQMANNIPLTSGFKDAAEFKLAKWFQENQVSQNARTEFFKLEAVKRMELSYSSNHTLNNKIDQLPKGPEWTKWTTVITGNRKDRSGNALTETATMFKRDTLEAVAELVGDPRFADQMSFAPEEAFVDEAKTCRIFDEMKSGTAWARVQNELPEGATVIPVIIYSDKTHLTSQQGCKEAWPVYMSIGNISSETRTQVHSGATILVGQLPVTDLEKKRLFHESMRELLRPLVEAGKTGVYLTCADGKVRWCFPVLMGYVADNPEQCMIACCKENRCHICTIHPNLRGDPLNYLRPNPASGKCAHKRDPVETYNLLLYYESGRHGAVDFTDQGLKPFGVPFWANLPHCDIYSCLAPDLLHQLHKGVFECVLDWCLDAINDDTEVDRRMAALTTHPNLRHFTKGFTHLKQSTGTEYRHIQKVILGVLAGLVPNDVHNAMRAILDFIYYAQLPTHTTHTLILLSNALDTWHNYKDVFIRLGIRTTPLYFRTNKIHSMEHYPGFIVAVGSPRGFNTELPERLHIITAKDPYKATNHKDFIQQMCKNLTRSESMNLFDRFLEWAAASPESGLHHPTHRAVSALASFGSNGIPPFVVNVPSTLRGTFRTEWSLPQSSHGMTQLALHYVYKATDFLPQLINYLSIRQPHPNALPTAETGISVYNQAIVRLSDPFTNDFEESVRACPIGTLGEAGDKSVEGFFDTVLVRDDWTEDGCPLLLGLHAQLRVIFTLPESLGVPEALAYVELFTLPRFEDPISNIGMHRVRRAMALGVRKAQIVPVAQLYRSVQLLPIFGGRKSGWDWAHTDALEVCDTFYVNRYLDEHTFMLLFS